MDVVKLIDIVREHIYLYDLNHDQYKDASLKAATWESIGRVLNESGEAARNKWKTIRDGYTKYKKQLKSSSGSNRKNCRYTWASQLSFLDDFNVPRGSSSNVSVDTPQHPCSQAPALDFDDLHNQWNSPLQSTSSSQIPPSSEFVPPDSPVNISTSRAACRKKKRSPENRQDDDDDDDDLGRVLEIVNSKKKKLHDVVDNLFLSYADTFKKFPAREQAIVKLELAKLFANTELQLLDNRSSNDSQV